MTNKAAAVKVAYATNEEGDIDVEEVMQEMALFMMASPQAAYSSKQKALEDYEAHLVEYQNLSEVLPDIIALAEYIPYRARTFYGDGFGEFRHHLRVGHQG